MAKCILIFPRVYRKYDLESLGKEMIHSNSAIPIWSGLKIENKYALSWGRTTANSRGCRYRSPFGGTTFGGKEATCTAASFRCGAAWNKFRESLGASSIGNPPSTSTILVINQELRSEWTVKDSWVLFRTVAGVYLLSVVKTEAIFSDGIRQFFKKNWYLLF